jgi:transposase
LQSEMVHKLGLPFEVQRRVVILRDKGWSWESIAGDSKVRNRDGQPTTWGNCRNVYNRLCKKVGRVSYNYKNCGRKKVLTPEHEKWLVETLLRLRKKGPVTSPQLQRLLAAKKGVRVEVSLVQKALKKNGYRWLPRSKKPKYTAEQCAVRKAFADANLELSDEELRRQLSACWDGVVIAVPPTAEDRRANFCRSGETHCWRKESEAAHPDLLGYDKYKKQVPLSRAIPLWGAISADGFAPVVWHKKHKLDEEEWVQAIEHGKLKEVLQSLNPARRRGPWNVLSDNESFLLTDEAYKTYRKQGVRLRTIPPRSPDLNPIEKFWGWLRRDLARRDLKDLSDGKPVPPKKLYLKRVQAVLRSRRAQEVASNCAKRFRKDCQEVSDNGGQASK